MAPVEDAQIAAQARLREIVVQAVRNAWTALDRYDAPDVPVFLASVVPLILAAQRQSVSLSDAYIAGVLGRSPLGIDPLPVIARLRGPVSPQIVYRRPFVTVWSGLSDGKPYEDAVRAGLARAEASAALDVQLAHFAGLQAVQDQDPRVRGWRRVADPGACEWCRMIDGAKVKRADASPLHSRCGCALFPLTDSFAPDPVPAGLVHDHGEYGPTLGNPEHDHLTPAEALNR